MDSANQFLVGATEYGMIRIIGFAHLAIAITPEQALNLAAWLVVLADPGGEEFDKLRKQIEQS